MLLPHASQNKLQVYYYYTDWVNITIYFSSRYLYLTSKCTSCFILDKRYSIVILLKTVCITACSVISTASKQVIVLIPHILCIGYMNKYRCIYKLIYVHIHICIQVCISMCAESFTLFLIFYSKFVIISSSPCSLTHKHHWYQIPFSISAYEQINCGSPKKIVDAFESHMTSTYKSKVDYICPEGELLNSICEENNEWTQIPKTCNGNINSFYSVISVYFYFIFVKCFCQRKTNCVHNHLAGVCGSWNEEWKLSLDQRPSKILARNWAPSILSKGLVMLLNRGLIMSINEELEVYFLFLAGFRH